MACKPTKVSLQELKTKIVDFEGSTPKIKAKKFCPRLKLFREFALATLSCLVKTKQLTASAERSEVSCEDASPQLPVLDAVSASGVAALQWKTRFGSDIHVTAVEHDDTTLLQSNAELNSFTANLKVLNSKRLQGDPVTVQKEQEIDVLQAEAKTVMSTESFRFIYLHPHKHCMAYFDSLCNSISNRGVLCVVVSDVSMFARSPAVTRRYYSADVIKTEYLKECAARIVLANLAISAAKSNKGICPLYIVSLEDYLLVCVKATRGHGAADNCLAEITQLMHCRMCEERTFVPKQLAPLEEPYRVLQCECKSNNPGKTAVLLGPMWKGPLFDHNFLTQLSNEGKSLQLSGQFATTCSLLLEESLCPLSSTPSSNISSLITTNKAEEKSDSSESQTSELPSLQISQTSEVLNQPNSETSDISNLSKSQTSEIPNSLKSKNSESELLSESQISGCTSPSSVSHEPINGSKAESGIIEKEDKVCGNKNENSVDLPDEGDKTDGKIEDKVSAYGDRENHKESLKRPAEDEADTKEVKHSRVTFIMGEEQPAEKCTVNIPFYQRVSKFKKTHVPKLNRLVIMLRSAGHHASRTHFDPCAIRTSATVYQFTNIQHSGTDQS